ncbi:MAG: tRNA pseudouridine(38-40) synthase TruA [Candidatus Eremiobacteraeota bacterium]|nr:tRNA pseudouridine(38-40) synthase TruA [Candidatus Eremiobacteraeota bacterium]
MNARCATCCSSRCSGNTDNSIDLRLAVEYDGTEFAGFQWQPAVRTVAGTLESALATLLHEPAKITGAGRTDSGVHATGQVVTFSTASTFPVERLAVALNASLPRDCSVREAVPVETGFSARFSAIERTYEYAILNRPQRSALTSRYAYHVARPLDEGALREAGAPLLGEHDFRSFAATGDGGSTVRVLRGLTVERRGELMRIRLVADSFLHHMVRTIVGTLLQCATDSRPGEAVSAILAARDRRAAGPTAPAAGLCLAGVRYPDGYDSYAPHPLWHAGSLGR